MPAILFNSFMYTAFAQLSEGIGVENGVHLVIDSESDILAG